MAQGDVKKVVLAYSGGLDTSIILKWLQTTYGCEVVTFPADLGQGDVAVTLTLQQEGEPLRGSLQGALGSGEIANASITQAGEVRFTVKINLEGQTAEATFTGTITGNDMKGRVSVGGRAPCTFTGTRAAVLTAPSAATTPARSSR